MERKYLIFLGAVFFIFAITNTVAATPVQWSSSAGGNDHWYEAVYVEELISWNDAKDAAEALGGYLATSTSPGENSFLYDLVNDSQFWIYVSSRDTYWGPWIGGYWDTYTTSWSWVTGETWSYAPWDSYQSGPGVEPFVHFHGSGSPQPKWNDIYDNYSLKGYLVEYDSSPVPEPTTMMLFGSGIAGLLGIRLRRKK